VIGAGKAVSDRLARVLSRFWLAKAVNHFRRTS